MTKKEEWSQFFLVNAGFLLLSIGAAMVGPEHQK